MAGELGVVVFWVVGVLGLEGGEAEGIGSEVVVGGAGREGFDEPEGGGSGLGGDFAEEGDADGGGAVAEGAEGRLESVAESGEEGLEEGALVSGDGVIAAMGALEALDGFEVIAGEAAEAGGWFAVIL